jgi:ribosomal protein S18 acetylase RimI-like enzyme
MKMRVSLRVDVRPARPEDLEQLAPEIEQALHAEYVRRMLSERREDVVFVLAFANGCPVGRLGIDFGRKADQGIAHLWAFDVLSNLRRLGIGTALIREAESIIASAPHSATVVEIGVDDGNDDAARLYRRLGYRNAGSERGGSGELIHLLRRRVSAIRRK